VIDAEVVQVVHSVAPIASPEPAPPASPVVVIYPDHRGSGCAAALGGALGAFSAIALLTPPIGCITIPLILVMTGLIVLGVIGAVTSVAGAIWGLFVSLWPMGICAIPASLCWMKAQKTDDADNRGNFVVAAAGLTALGIGGWIINLIVLSRAAR